MIILRLLLAVTISLANASLVDAFFWGWRRPYYRRTAATTTATTSGSTSSSATASNYAIKIGDRENTFANLTDSGTMLSNIQINLAAFNGTTVVDRTRDDWFSNVILQLAHEYQIKATDVVFEHLAWIERTTVEAFVFATELRQQIVESGGFLEEFVESIRTNIHNVPAERCSGGKQFADETIQSIRNHSGYDCLEERLRHLIQLGNAATFNLTELLNTLGNPEDHQLRECEDVHNNGDTGAGSLNRLACVTSAILKLKEKILKLEYAAYQMTADAESALYRAKANILECVADLTSYVFKVSLRLYGWITNCGSGRHI
ncbi:uncharacterized protein LOC129776055 [Toxorhynchites rutilus septentrionalis]|uniref:uncharacterized protein LOC129776055 n=1 Tax=Toxorhynchites rutilus septentrionalis TaxID=329112 RepID=UPI00247A6C91|nr:uncharacterized protein LOC129776055 [Toxorhynchites rutilus septentrionalis]